MTFHAPDKPTVKTTVEINADLLYKARLKAIEEQKSLKQIINDSLAKELQTEHISGPEKKITIGGHWLGGIRGALCRVDIYENF